MKRLAGLLLVVLLVGMSAAPAGAINLPIPGLGDTSCKSAPTPSTPGTGIPAIFDGHPDGGSVTSYDLYQYGPQWSTYDTGCTISTDAWWAGVDTHGGNMIYGFAADLVAFGNGIHHMVAPPTFLSAFDGVETSATQTLYENIYLPFLILSLLLLAIFLLAAAHKGDMAASLKKVAWAVLVMAIAAIAYSGPVKLGHAADQLEVGTVNTVDTTLAGPTGSTADGPASLEVGSVLRPAWMQGEVGASSGPIVDTYGATLWDSQALTWQEAGAPDVSKIIDAKKKTFEQTASTIHDQSQSTYDVLKGQHSGRLAAGLYALFGALCTVPFRLVADILLLMSLVLIRIVVVFLPVLALVALHDRMSALLLGTLSAVGAALLNAGIFAAAAGFNTLVVGVLLSTSSPVPQWAGLILSALLSILLWYVTKPFRKLTTMVSKSYSPVHGVASEVKSSVKHTVHAGFDLALLAGSGGASAAAKGAAGRSPRREALGDTGAELPAPATEPVAPPAPVEVPVRQEAIPAQLEEPEDDVPFRPIPGAEPMPEVEIPEPEESVA